MISAQTNPKCHVSSFSVSFQPSVFQHIVSDETNPAGLCITLPAFAFFHTACLTGTQFKGNLIPCAPVMFSPLTPISPHANSVNMHAKLRVPKVCWNMVGLFSIVALTFQLSEFEFISNVHEYQRNAPIRFLLMVISLHCSTRFSRIQCSSRGVYGLQGKHFTAWLSDCGSLEEFRSVRVNFFFFFFFCPYSFHIYVWASNYVIIETHRAACRPRALLCKSLFSAVHVN